MQAIEMIQRKENLCLSEYQGFNTLFVINNKYFNYWVLVFLIPQQIMSSPHCPRYQSFETTLHKAA